MRSDVPLAPFFPLGGSLDDDDPNPLPPASLEFFFAWSRESILAGRNIREEWARKHARANDASTQRNGAMDANGNEMKMRDFDFGIITFQFDT